MSSVAASPAIDQIKMFEVAAHKQFCGLRNCDIREGERLLGEAGKLAPANVPVYEERIRIMGIISNWKSIWGHSGTITSLQNLEARILTYRHLLFDRLTELHSKMASFPSQNVKEKVKVQKEIHRKAIVKLYGIFNTFADKLYMDDAQRELMNLYYSKFCTKEVFWRKDSRDGWVKVKLPIINFNTNSKFCAGLHIGVERIDIERELFSVKDSNVPEQNLVRLAIQCHSLCEINSIVCNLLTVAEKLK